VAACVAALPSGLCEAMSTSKIRSVPELARELKRLQGHGKRIVFTNGCFDLLHVGHTRYLERARALGDYLVVAVNSDRSMRRIKGPERPILPEQDRAEILAAFAFVDFVTIFDEDDPLKVIQSLEPDVLVKGGDWTPEKIIGREFVEQRGGRVVTIPYVAGASTTSIIQRILELAGEEAAPDRGDH
jgi:rfaE bifunctional protein nucleotidyltransferase chain/domain